MGSSLIVNVDSQLKLLIKICLDCSYLKFLANLISFRLQNIYHCLVGQSFRGTNGLRLSVKEFVAKTNTIASIPPVVETDLEDIDAELVIARAIRTEAVQYVVILKINDSTFIIIL